MRQLATTLFGTGTIMSLVALLVREDLPGLLLASLAVVGAVAVGLLEEDR